MPKGQINGQIHINLPPGHPMMAIRNNRNHNGRRIGKKVYWPREMVVRMRDVLATPGCFVNRVVGLVLACVTLLLLLFEKGHGRNFPGDFVL